MLPQLLRPAIQIVIDNDMDVIEKTKRACLCGKSLSAGWPTAWPISVLCATRWRAGMLYVKDRDNDGLAVVARSLKHKRFTNAWGGGKKAKIIEKKYEKVVYYHLIRHQLAY